MNEPSYAVVWPRGPRVKQEIGLAKRLDTLDGKNVGFIWNGVFFGDEMFTVIEKALMARFHRIKLIKLEEFNITKGEGDFAKVIATSPDKLERYNFDAVIFGVGC
jgi:hypothetical protein